MEDMPPGFRFYPTEEELISFYLYNKLQSRNHELNLAMDRVIPVLDIYNFIPSDLPHYAGYFCNKDPEQWFFFIPRRDSETRGGRPNRLTSSGYWKATGSPGYVYSSNHHAIGVKRSMVFYEGKAPNGRKTEWKMNEYKAVDIQSSSTYVPLHQTPKLLQEFSLCRVYKRSKCFRAFDRRPLSVDVIVPQLTEGTNQAISQEYNPAMVEITSLLESSSSCIPMESGSMEMGTEDEPVWDWNEFDWDPEI